MMGWKLPVSLTLLCIVCVSASPQQDTKKDCCKPVNGKWTMWTKYSPCSVSCGSGTRTRKRYCGSPAPQYGGSGCSGKDREQMKCVGKRECPVNGNWTETTWGPCTKPCGKGNSTGLRTCTKPFPRNCGKKCPGDAILTRSCNEQACDDPRNCTTPCQLYGKNCERRCTFPCKYEKRYCKKPFYEKVTITPCETVDGGWTNYTYTKCSQPCGLKGIQEGTRNCTNPKPLNCGKECPGNRIIKNVPCNRDKICPPRDICDANCTLVNDVCQKECKQKCPYKDKYYCQSRWFNETQIVKCNSTDGGWSDYTYDNCTAPCGNKGTKVGTRTCTNPKPVNCGKNCPGPDQTTFKCNRKKCQTPPPCTTPCKLYGNNCQRRCIYPCPYENRYCKDPWYKNETITPCETVDGQWSGWKMGVCSKTCGGGVRTDTRMCNNPSPLNCGKDCVGNETRQEKCNVHKCPTPIIKCEGCKKYGNKCEQYCTRICIYHKNDRDYCAHLGPIITKKPCETRDAGWSRYKFGACSKTCGGGFRTGKRVCNNPTRLNCGKPCTGSDTITEKCGTCPCPKWGPPINCGKCQQLKGGKCQRTCDRNCIFERNDKPYCGKDSTIKQNCKSVNGGWTDFKYVIKCGKCDGQSKKVRHCIKPKPEGCGKPCVGQSVVIENCPKCPDWGPWNCTECKAITKGNCKRTCTRICFNRKKGCTGDSSKYESCKCPGTKG